mgnify:CR=1 FL=1
MGDEKLEMETVYGRDGLDEQRKLGSLSLSIVRFKMNISQNSFVPVDTWVL